MIDLVALLNAAVSQDPSIVISAGHQLVDLTSYNDANRKVYANLASVVFDTLGQTQLTPNGRLAGMLHLKNALFSSNAWFSLDELERNTVRSLLLNFLASGCQPETRLNSIEALAHIGPCVSELIGRLVKMEWLKECWSDGLWSQLITWCSWRSLRFGLRAAASYRLQVRRRAFHFTVVAILPQLVNDILLQLTTDSLEATIHLLRLLYSCFTLATDTGSSTRYIFVDSADADSAQPPTGFGIPVLHVILERAFFILAHRDEAVERPDGLRLVHRAVKLIVATLLATSPQLRSICVDGVLSRCLACLVPGKSRVPRKTAGWLIALIYALLPVNSGVSPYVSGAQLALPDEGIAKVRTWLKSPASLDGQPVSAYSHFLDTSSSNLALLVSVVTDPHWFAVPSTGLLSLVTDPEACMATGGLSAPRSDHDLADPRLSGNSSITDSATCAASIWDVDVACRTTVAQADSLASLMGMHGAADQSPVSSVDPCRELAELILFRLARFHFHDSGPLLRQFISSRIEASASVDSFGLESAMRVAQLFLVHLSGEDSAEDLEWMELTGRLLTAGISNVSWPSTGSEEDELLVTTFLKTRILCLMARHAVCCVPMTRPDHEAYMISQCSTAVGHLADCLLHGVIATELGSPDAAPSSSSDRSSNLCLRLAAIHSVAWLLHHAAFPPESLTAHLPALFNGLVKLIQDVRECETRIYLLGVLCTLIESADLIGDPQLANSMLGLLDELWRLEQEGTALRAAILDAVSILVTVLNAFPDETEANLVHLRASLHHPVVTLTLASVGCPDSRSADALFEPGLRLLHSLVSGDGATWSPALAQLLPLLTGGSPASSTSSMSADLQSPLVATGFARSGGDGGLVGRSADGVLQRQPLPLVQRLETREQAELFFQISAATLQLACSSGDQALATQFLELWTEPFWNSIFTVSAGQPTVHGVMVNQDSLRSNGGHLLQRLDYLFSQAATAVSGDDDSHTDDESQCRISQLRLLAIWLSTYLDHYFGAGVRQPRPQHQLQSPIPLPPGMIGLLAQVVHGSLVRAPNSEHDDVHPRATRVRLAILARLAVCPQPWSLFLHLLEVTLQATGALDLQITPNQLVQTCLIRWLARADSTPECIDRRCLSVACWLALRHCHTTVTRRLAPAAAPPISSLVGQTDELERWAVADSVHARWLEPVVSLCIQVCCEEERDAPCQADRFYRAHPRELTSRSALLTRMVSEFSVWRDYVGGPAAADALFCCHVEPVLRNQLERHLGVLVLPGPLP